MRPMDELEAELKELIVESLFLEDIAPADIASAEPLFEGGGLELDSIDALEIGIAIRKKYGVKIDPDDKDVKEYFRSVRSLAAFISDGR
jgi:acyl carrier protein